MKSGTVHVAKSAAFSVPNKNDNPSPMSGSDTPEWVFLLF